jgi:dienelactone hydrolase
MLSARLAAVSLVGALVLTASPARAAEPAPGSAGYVARDAANMAEAYGRQTAPDGQLSPAYLAALTAHTAPRHVEDLVRQAANPTRPALTLATVLPGANAGNPLRHGWENSRGVRTPVSFTSRAGALLVGDVYSPLPGARDPYTGARLDGPYPTVVLEPGSAQGSGRMYEWLAQDLAERGYVVLLFDVQGEGRSETFPHQGPVADLPYCNPLAPPGMFERTGCPGVPFQQVSGFVTGLQDAITFALSTPDRPYPHEAAGSAGVSPYNPVWRLADHRPVARPVTPGRTTRLAVVGHSMGAYAASYVQGVDSRVMAAVALDKLASGALVPGATGRVLGDVGLPVTPVVPSLGLQSEYGFTVTPYTLSGASSIAPQPIPPTQAPDPRREQKTGFDGWRAAGVDTMVVVPRASTHLEYTDIALALPASRYGQALSSVYTQAWLGSYLGHDGRSRRALDATSWTYLEPRGDGVWAPIVLDRAARLSRYYCSGIDVRHGGRSVDPDLSGVGCYLGAPTG